MKTTQYRQGDVLIQSIYAMPKQLTPISPEKGQLILAHGEVTGHAHAIAGQNASLFSTEELGVRFLEVTAAVAALSHDEHSTINIPHGAYKVTRQREYSPQEVRPVKD